ncbi:3-hydroxyisobutyryl-CoA hydrolase [hydrothermal vent metagenome]|uniref:3-hydroxyisobutyryl-CoA hydrolase n=1 Tax=hydrothermal vent metagenome TaxID=652676 RepID=A0A3B0TA18_9ZZZZ
MTGSGEDEVLFHRQDRAGVITLNRPGALNALTLNMVRRMDRVLRDWAGDDAVERVIIQAAPGRAFCAGGDIRAIYDWGRAGDPDLLRFYFEEYRLNRLIKRYPKPYIAMIDGIVMGGGVGVSVHGSHRVVSSESLFAMPETGIGFFPDVGGSYFLPRCPGQSGLFLGLTGTRIKPADMLWAGIATHLVPSAGFDELTAELAGADDVEAVLAARRDTTDPTSNLSTVTDEIDEFFSGENLEAILHGLVASASEFGQKTAHALVSKSPTSLGVVFRQLTEGRALDFEACMKLEFRLVSRFVAGHDLYEGIRAVVIDKDGAPKWRPAKLEEVTPEAVAAYFAPLDEELTFIDLSELG